MRRHSAKRHLWNLSFGALVLAQVFAASPPQSGSSPSAGENGAAKAIATSAKAVKAATDTAGTLEKPADVAALIAALDKDALTQTFKDLADAQTALASALKEAQKPPANNPKADSSKDAAHPSASSPSDPTIAALNEAGRARDAASRRLKDAILASPKTYNGAVVEETKKRTKAIRDASDAATSFGVSNDPKSWTDLADKFGAAQKAESMLANPRKLDADKQIVKSAIGLEWVKSETGAAAALEAVGKMNGDGESVAAGIKSFKTDLQGESLVRLLDRVKEAIANRAKALEEDFGTFAQRPATRAKGISDRQKRELDFVAAADKLVDAIAAIGAWDAAKGAPGGPLRLLAPGLVSARQARELLNSVAQTLPDAVNGSSEAFVGRYVPLYYVRDVPSLIRILNSDRDSDSSSPDPTSLQAQRIHVLQAQDDLQTKAVALADAKGKLAGLRQQAEAALAKLTSLNTLLDRQKADQTRTQTRANVLDRQIERLKEDAAAKPDDKGRAERVRRAEEERARVGDRLTEQSSAITDTTAKQSEAKSAYDQAASDADEPGLKQQVASAETALRDAAVARLGAQQALRLAEAGEDAEFVKFRDSHPLIATKVNPLAQDPTKRVQIFGFEGSASLFLRGTPDDVAAVERIVAEYDRPTPQARLTVWELQLNVAQNDFAPRVFAERRKKVEEDMRDLRTAMSGTVDLFVRAVNEVANERSGAGGFYSTEVLGVLNGKVPASDADLRDPRSASTLGEALLITILAKDSVRSEIWQRFLNLQEEDPAIKKKPEKDSSLYKVFSDALDRYGLRFVADPIRPPSNGKELPPEPFVRLRQRLHLSRPSWVKPIAVDARDSSKGFRYEINGETVASLASGNPRWMMPNVSTVVEKMADNAAGSQTTTTRTVTVSSATATKPAETLTPMQAEIVYAIASRRLIASAHRLNELLPHVQSEILREARTELQKALDAYATKQSPKLGQNSSATGTVDVADVLGDGKPLQLALNQAYRLRTAIQNPEVLRQFAQDASTSDLQTLGQILSHAYGIVSTSGYGDPVPATFALGVERLAGMLGAFARTSGASRMTSWDRLGLVERITKSDIFQAELNAKNANARAASADAMIKEVMKALEDDFDEALVQPGLEAIRKDVTDSAIGFGKLQKTSVLVSNRFLARVDGRAEAEVAPGKQTDILDDALGLAQLMTAASGTNPVGLLGLMKGVDKTPQGLNEIYGITSNGLLQVTPVFEPSGQALRFSFDYGIDTRIQEPNGTINTRVPQIERHTVHNEMQVGNLELREVSSFSATSKLGLPTKKWGGIPVLKDIPVLSEIPIVGWFHYRKSRAAVSQESIIFAQTSLYPTVGDLLDLFGGD